MGAMNVKPPIQQAKENILRILRENSGMDEIIYPCLPQDLADYRSALDLVEVQREFRRRGVRARAVDYRTVQPQQSEIVIATYEDTTNGNLDNYLKNRGFKL
jgi:hypothetical protein